MPERRHSFVWIAVYVAASIAACSPFLAPGSFGTGADWGDARLIAWTLAWHARWPLVGAWPLDAPFFAPEAAALAYSEPMLALGLATAPITALLGPFFSFDLLRVAIPVANGLAMAFLAWHFLRDSTAAFVAGVAVAFAYQQVATMYLGMVHLGVVASYCVTAVYLDRWWHTGAVSLLVRAVAAAGIGALVSWYSAVVAIVAIACQLAWLVAIEWPGGRTVARRFSALLASGVAALALLYPLAKPFMGTPRPDADELRLYSLAAGYFVRPPGDTWIGYVLNGVTAPVSWDYRRSYFVGFVAAATALAGLAVGLRTATGRRLLWSVPVVVAGFLLSLGPGPDGSWRPFDLVSALPGLASFRVPGRMAVLVPFGMAMLIGLAVHGIPRRARTACGVGLAVLLFGEAHMAFLPPVSPHALETPAIFRAAERERPSGLLVLPMLGGTSGWPSEADYLLYAMPAWMPVLNGYGRRTSSIYDAVQHLVKEKRQDLGEALRFYEVSHVIVLKNYLPPGADAAAHVAWSDDLEFVVAADGDLLYRVRPGSSQISLHHVRRRTDSRRWPRRSRSVRTAR